MTNIGKTCRKEKINHRLLHRSLVNSTVLVVILLNSHLIKIANRIKDFMILLEITSRYRDRHQNNQLKEVKVAAL